jgi:GAF domain-containing protein
MERLLSISHKLTSSLSLEAILHRIVLDAAELLECESVGILLLDEAAQNLRFVAATLFHDQLLDIPVPIHGSIAGAAFSSGQPTLVPDVSQDPRYYSVVGKLIGLPARSLLAVPLQFREHKIGVLEAENKTNQKQFDALDIETLTALAV